MCRRFALGNCSEELAVPMDVANAHDSPAKGAGWEQSNRNRVCTWYALLRVKRIQGTFQKADVKPLDKGTARSLAERTAERLVMILMSKAQFETTGSVAKSGQLPT
jgi:hypothetical protein